MLSVSTILGGAFAMIRQRIGAIAIWALLYLALIVAMAYAMRPWIADMMAIQQIAPGTPPDHALMFQSMGKLFGVQLGMMLVLLVLYTAALRAAVRPEERDFAYLRLGADELRMLGVGVILFFAFFALTLALEITAVLIGIVLSMAARDAMIPVIIVLVIALFSVLVYFQVRLSLAFPLTLIRGKIAIGESWRLTRGRFWTLFGGYFVLGLIVFAVYLVILAINLGPYLTELGRTGLDPAALRAVQRAQLERQLAPVSVLTVCGWLLGALLGSIVIALGAGATGSATLALLDEVYGENGDVGAGYA